MTEFICKHCGSDSEDIYAEVEARGWADGGVYATSDGAPYFEIDRTEYDEVDVIDHRCNNCRQSAFKLGDLVVKRTAVGELRQPCGRCDHDVGEHPLVGFNIAVATTAAEQRGYTRPPRPCEVEGCDCHDFYDTALALPSEDQLELAT